MRLNLSNALPFRELRLSQNPHPLLRQVWVCSIHTNMCERYSNRCVDGLVDLILRIRVVFVFVLVIELDIIPVKVTFLS